MSAHLDLLSAAEKVTFHHILPISASIPIITLLHNVATFVINVHVYSMFFCFDFC